MACVLTYVCLGNNQYEVTLKFYRDCGGVFPFCQSTGTSTTCSNGVCTTTKTCSGWDNPVISYSSVNCGLNGQFEIFAVPSNGTRTEVTPICANEQSTCGDPNSQYPGAEEWLYRGIVTLPANCTDWKFSFEVGNRNGLISTIATPDQVMIHVDAELDNTIAGCNSSPEFSNAPVPWICVGQLYCFNHGALDSDGDSLVYSLVIPKTGATSTVTYNTGYSASNPLQSNPPLTLDTKTGDLCMTPQMTEVTVMAVKVDEYRNGQWIGSVTRDMQLVVINCTNNLPTASGIDGSDDFEITVCENQPFCFDIFSDDLDAGQIVTMDWNNGIPAGTFTIAGSPHPTGTFCWTPTSADVRSTPYTFTVDVNDDNCPYSGGQTFSYTIYVEGPCSPNISLDADPEVICLGECTDITATVSNGSPPLVVTWDQGLPTGTGPHNVCPTTTTIYHATVTDAVGETDTASVTVTVNQPPVITFTSADPSCSGVCNGSISLNVSGNPTYTYVWDTSCSDVSCTGLCEGTYNVTVTDVNGCEATETITLNAPVSVTLNISSTALLCNNDCDATATVTPSGGTVPYGYLWGDGQTDQTATGLCAGTQHVIVTDANGCTDSISVTITVPNAIVFTTSVTDISCFALCDGTGTINASGGNPPIGLQWSNGQTSATATGLCVGTYTVTMTDASGCSDTAQVHIQEPPALVATETHTNVSCFGGSDGTITASVTGGVSPYDYNWDNSETTSLVTGIPIGNHCVTVTDQNGCTAVVCATLTEPSELVLSTTTTLATCGQCNGSASVSPSGGTSIYTYLWDVAASDQITATASGLCAGTYNVTVTDANGCTATIQSNVSNNGAPTADIPDSTAVSCFGVCDGEATVTVSGGTTPYIYQWNDAASQTGATATGLCEGSYSVCITDGLGCIVCTDVIINGPPAINLTYTSIDESCGNGNGNGSITVTASGGSGGFSYLWDAAAGNQVSATASGLSQGTYCVTVTDANGCTNYICATIINANSPVALFQTQDICFDGSMATFTYASSGTIATCSWDFGDGQTAADCGDVSHLYSAPGTYVVTHCVADPAACQSCFTDTVRILDLPVVCFGDSTVGCVPLSVMFTNCSDPGATYEWDFGSAGVSTEAQPTVIFDVAGCYDVSLTVTSLEGCVNTTTKPCYIEAYPLPTAGFDANPWTANLFSPVVNFTDKSTNAVRWLWSFGDSLTDTIQNPVHEYADTGCYPVWLWMENQYGCIDSTMGTVCIVEVPTLYIPNAFSPNGDGFNDLFMAKGIAIESFEMYVFDRWGNLIYQATDINQGWNGKVEGSQEPAQEDVYVWLVKATDIYGENRKLTGHVTLVR
ncbi:MAG: gliding motility-associated C-terminal domain-containing protein [Flavobacteriales bacterium]|nr:gliding motility-associated C-terminal domain-containing protein [Flavobacteriales bacterium]